MKLLSTICGLGLLSLRTWAAIDCPTSGFEYDYIVVGSGAGGGPLAARLGLAGYKVLVIEHGRDVVSYNTTIPLYLAKASDDPETTLDYYVQHNPPGSGDPIVAWYPRASALGGSTIHNALVNVLQAKPEWDNLAAILGDDSWNDTNMRNYFKKLENNLYVPSLLGVGDTLGHGYGGWLSTQFSPLNLLLDPKYLDTQLIDIATGLQLIGLLPQLPFLELNSVVNEGKRGGAFPVLTKKADGTRCSVRDFQAATAAQKPNLTFKFETMATKILTCDSASGVKAYGVQVAEGAHLLPVSRLFKGKQDLANITKTYTAKYEIIVSAGAYQTPQLLKLSGIGLAAELTKYNIPVRSNLPGVGENFVDRLELSVVWNLKQDHVVFKGCKFGDDPSTDPCLSDWINNGHSNLYSAGPSFWTDADKSDNNLPYLDILTNWAPAQFQGYYRGYPVDTANNPNILSAILLKARTKSRGWVRLKSADPQDTLEINKNLYATAEGQADKVILRELVKSTRARVAAEPLINLNIVNEKWPGSNVTTDAQIDAFIDQHAWGHHACCTAKIGAPSDPNAVLNKDFQVRGVQRLRVVDNSVFPEIPGFFVTTLIYMVSEKASDVILATAKANNWNPTT